MNLSSIGRLRVIIGCAIIGLLVIGVVITQQSAPSNAASYSCSPVTTKVAPSTHDSIREYTLPQPNSDLMSPAVDQNGNLWFGEMGGNRLGRYNPATSEITEWSPPQGRSGIMGITVDSTNTIWFAEESANYIGSFVPATCQFKIYPLPMHNGYGAAPNAISFAPDGILWFTQVGNNTVGSLDTKSGAIRQYPLPTTSADNRPVPYGIAVDPSGAVWATHLEAPILSRLDPTSGKWTEIPLATPHAQVNTITVGAGGQLWFTEMAGVVGTVDPATNQVKEIAVPASYGNVAQLYDIQSNAAGGLWITSSGSNSLLSYQPVSGAWNRVTLPVAASSPYGLVVTAEGIWFTEGAADANRIGFYDTK